MPAYTTAAAIGAYLGVALTPEQATQADVVAAAITTLIDHRTGRTWQATGPVAAEFQTVAGNRLYLDHPPVTAVSAVVVHPGDVSGAWTALDPSEFTLADALVGSVDVVAGYSGYYARVDYTSAASGAPEDVELAATVLAADLLSTALNPESAGAESVSVGQNDITVRYAGAAGQIPAPIKAALAVIDSYRRVVLA